MSMIGLRQHKTCRASAGFTLMELIIVIVLTGIVAAITAAFITRPIEGYVDLTRRAALVDSAESSLRRMARDIRIALPNSVRITNTASGYALELIPTLDGARYSVSGLPSQALDFTAADTDFDINGCFQRYASLPATTRIVINNLGTSGQDNVYTAVIGTPSVVSLGTTIAYSVNPVVGICGTAGAVHHITLNPGYQFKQNSPLQRVFVIQTPVTYLCDTTAGTLTRYADYTIQSAQPTTAVVLDGLANVTKAVVANYVNTCSATTTAGQVQLRGLVTLDLGLADQGETIRLIHQVQLDNSR